MNAFIKTPKLLSGSFKNIIWSVPTDRKEFFLTFDDGPIPDNTQWILSELNKYQAKATFFCVGENVKKFPEIFKGILKNGHAVGNHTFNHLNSWKNNNTNYLQNIALANQYIDSIYFRPPYGKLSFNALRQIKRDFQIVLWDILSRDFDTGISSETCLNNVLKNAIQGSIIVFHDNYKATKHLKYVLPRILDYYSSLGYSFKSLESFINTLRIPA